MTRPATRQRDGRIVPAWQDWTEQDRQHAKTTNAEWQARERKPGILQRIFRRK